MEIRDCENVLVADNVNVGGSLTIGNKFYILGTQKDGLYLNSYSVYKCNRIDESDTFYESFCACKKKSVQHYVIHGLKKDCHDNFFGKLFHDYIQDEELNSIAKTIPIQDSTNFNVLKDRTLSYLFRVFNNDKEYKKEDFSINGFYKLPGVINNKNIVVHFIIRSEYWDTSNQFFDFIIKNYKSYNEEHDFKIIFFWSIVYKNDDNKKWLKIKFKKKTLISICKSSKELEILKHIRKRSPECLLPKLKEIEKGDIFKWLSEIEIEHYNKTNRRIDSKLYNEIKDKHLLEKKDKFRMYEVLNMYYTIEEKYKKINDE